jgi:uracil-DNA glycosylase family 4
MKYASLGQVNQQVVRCKACPRLLEYAKKIVKEKVKRFSHEDYWARPVPSWGDPRARLLIVGLAPAAHGGNRTGRMFTGDSSGDWLARVLHETGFANMANSRSRDDGLTLNGAYVTAAVRCAPPGNRPARSELDNCSEYLVAELKLLTQVKVVLALGRIAFGAYCQAAGLKGLTFGHGAQYRHGSGKTLVASYHPSRQNTNTGRLTWDMWLGVFVRAKSLV